MDALVYGFLTGFGGVIGAAVALVVLLVAIGGVAGYQYRKHGPGG